MLQHDDTVNMLLGGMDIWFRGDDYKLQLHQYIDNLTDLMHIPQ